MGFNTGVVLAIGLVSGLAGGFLGLGGGTVLIPSMIFLLGMNQHQAQGTALAAMLPPIGLLAVMEYYSAGNIDVKVSIFLALGFVFGGMGGAILAQKIPALLLKKAFAIFLIFVGGKILIGG